MLKRENVKVDQKCISLECAFLNALKEEVVDFNTNVTEIIGDIE